MISALIYLPAMFVRSIFKFLHHWYVDSFFNTSSFMLDRFENMDRSWALKINFRNLFKPLYQDPTIVGYILGFLFRGIKLLFGSIIYITVFIISAVLYILWLLIPPFIIFEIYKHYGA